MDLATQRTSWVPTTAIDGRESWLRLLPCDRYLVAVRTPTSETWDWALRVADPGNPQLAHGEGYADVRQARTDADFAALALSEPPPDPGRVFSAARKAQGFRSPEHLDAWFRYYDHTKACGECGKPGGGMWLEGSASWQPSVTVCPVARELDAVTQATR